MDSPTALPMRDAVRLARKWWRIERKNCPVDMPQRVAEICDAMRVPYGVIPLFGGRHYDPLIARSIERPYVARSNREFAALQRAMTDFIGPRWPANLED